ncbi:14054_t:CDS:2 [Funneliformis geosporum]|uniref:1422_t:CDS:1 n=1 Tax=Funneliformis geosporum TaxID=1117311 RepID=A0A9W4SJB9_9GLOM|nr:14054_t:CDS:2 [Funneliformis geosporum]CAI2170664.1 1422_t:CDS:2 [Funneliformis geosporum]
MTSEDNHSIYASACSSFAHPTKTHDYYPTIEYSRNDFIIISNSTITKLPSITNDVMQFVTNANENEKIDYARLRELLQNHDKKNSTTDETSNILGSLDELTNPIKNISQKEEILKEKVENEIEEVIKEVETVEAKNRKKVIEQDDMQEQLEQLREENERLKLELHAFKRNTRPFFTKESKSSETRRNIYRDKLYFKLQLAKVDELETEILSNLVKEIMLTLRIDDVNRVVPSLKQINKVMRVVPHLRDFC